MENEAHGKNFFIAPTEARIFHVTGKRLDNGEWWLRDRWEHDRDFQIYPAVTMQSIENYLQVVDRVGRLSEAKLLVVKPVLALALYTWGVIPVEQFQQATERSSAYFDIPGSALSDTLPLRIAQQPSKNLMIADERGYSLYEP